ncbi:MAG: hypothetical protein JW850_07115 [Thermoflexales bacterium]|nr:hypothetical protein [Thermoflexales bacterium]
MAFRRAFERWHLLFLISGLGLFFELAVVRWIAGEVRLFSYFKNLPLLSAFLGLAIGFALAGKGRDYRPAFAPLLALCLVLVLTVGHFSSPNVLVYPSIGDELLWNAWTFPYWVALIAFLGMVLIFFLATMFLFIPLGQATGEEMNRHAPVPAYIVNLLASLAGTWAFALLSYLQTPPMVWFGLGLLGVGFYLHTRQALSRTSLAIFAVGTVALGLSGWGEFWSPYQRLATTEMLVTRNSDGKTVKAGYTLNIQQVFYQYAVDLSPEFVADIPGWQDMAFMYNLPYRLRPDGGQVLILGAGMGNDVAAALRNDAARVDAVEIDPAIMTLGRRLHPERPYDDPRVKLIVDDARSFLKKNSDRYDIIAFGLLDSHTLLSGLSSVRLDSYVYTIESFQQARDHLAEDGVVVVAFATATPWIEERLGQMLIQVFDPDQVFVQRGTSETSVLTTFVAGQIPSDKLAEAQLSPWRPDPASINMPLGTDDWPYLYLRTRKIPDAYWQALLLIGLAYFVLIMRSFPEARSPNWHFWLLGAAFLLIEFKSISELALLFGATWLVNVLAISGVLLMALAANLLVLWRPRVNLRLAYGLLFASLALAYVFPLAWLIGLPPLVRALASMVLLSLPLFFAGLIFSESLRQAGEAAGPLASNLGGSVAGGILEYGSIWWGIKSLYVIAAVTYAGALLAFLTQRKR